MTKLDLRNIDYLYFIGIGGIGMSALARYFKSEGKQVSGYDRTATNLIKDLMDEDISINFIEDIELIDENILDVENKDKVLIVYTPAIPASSVTLRFFKQHNYHILKRSEVLGLISEQKSSIAIAGTHGKTTITTMVAHILSHSNYGCSAFLGGISKNYQSNLIVNNESNCVVVEADEFDRSFHTLFPSIAVITSIDSDHLDIYGTHDEITKSFAQFASQIKNGGTLIIKKGVELGLENKDVQQFTYALEEKADFYARKISVNDGKQIYNIQTPNGIIKDVELEYPGLVNVENSIAAIAIASLLGVDTDKIKAAIKSFAGVKRRFDIQFKNKEVVFIDDYAHHPKELSAVITSLRRLYPGKRIGGIFQPHLFTRTRDFASEFAKSLDLLDEAVVMEIYPAREEPIEGVSSQLILNKMSITKKYNCNKCEIIPFILRKNYDVLITMGAGDIDNLVEPIRKALEKKYSGQ